MVTFDDFKKLEIIVARIESVRDHPNADKLLILEIDTGKTSGQNETKGASASAGRGRKAIVAGIKNFYTKEELIGKNIVIIDNLEPAVIRGAKSEGMLLAVEDKRGISLITPDREVELGSRIR